MLIVATWVFISSKLSPAIEGMMSIVNSSLIRIA